ncbi:GAF domain-containing sensor histidine kinase [Actinoplanes lutulentus]|uniref:GAF domain-containing sensor histidine kinase n=1 Tax=Actinoplanes lutulentus TaxID=1287878 RepID=UPI000DB94513|nr:GAF domain-containing sensor histidine kinase [Actinoplanes lutulentus]
MYQILDTPVEDDFDDIAALAAQLCGTPMAAISLVDGDRLWFKARFGHDIAETPLAGSMCERAIQGDEVMQVLDAVLDPRFAGHPTVVGVPHVRFYAGAPLVSPSGQALGTLCVIGQEPGELNAEQCQSLRALARHVVSQMELRRYARDMRDLTERLRAAEEVKDEFIARVTHELRTPLSSIHGYLEVLGDPELPAETRDGFLARVQRNSDRLLNLVDDMLLAAQAGPGNRAFHRRPTDLAELAATAVAQNEALIAAKGLSVTVEAGGPVLADVDAARIGQALARLVLNAVKFTDSGAITVGATSHEGRAELWVRDTGAGISPIDRSRVLAPFRRAGSAERAEVQGAGLGLTIVKAIVDGHDGVLRIDGEPGHGTTVTIELPASFRRPESW